jgi:hypothetical protein
MKTLNPKGQNIMNTTNKPPEWGKWGEGKKEPKMKEYLELLLKFNNQSIEVMKEAKRDLEKKVKEHNG